MGKTKILRIVGRKNFNPVPNVDSALVLVELSNKSADVGFFDFLRLCFAMRRKTLSNNLKGKIDQQALFEKLESFGKTQTARAEELSPQELEMLYEISKNYKK